MSSVTSLLREWRQGDDRALAAIVPLVHRELRRAAARQLRGMPADDGVQTTALVNEAYLRLVGLDRVNWQDRAHFLAVAATQMRRVLIDAARARAAGKRGGEALRVSFDEAVHSPYARLDLLALDEALEALGAANQRCARVVELRFFGGLSLEETAEVLNISSDTVSRDWKVARAWLTRELRRASMP